MYNVQCTLYDVHIYVTKCHKIMHIVVIYLQEISEKRLDNLQVTNIFVNLSGENVIKLYSPYFSRRVERFILEHGIK